MEHPKSHEKNKHHYVILALMGIFSFIAMYILMYSMVDRFSNVYTHVNQFYMAGLMAMPMIIIEIILMRHMYKNKNLNAMIIGVSVLVMVGFYYGIRRQIGVSDRQFLKSMIPHHSGAILMCQQANIQDPAIKRLCEEIIASQQKEIDQMKSKLEEVDPMVDVSPNEK